MSHRASRIRACDAAPASRQGAGDATHRLGRLAVASLHAELVCAPKPGLVTPFDCGSHDDMDAGTFYRSLFALRGYFHAIAQAGMADAEFETLRSLGLSAEAAMQRATDGINTHRGAIFSLGLLTASAARCRRQAPAAPPSAEAVCRGVMQWADALLTAPLDARSHGQRAVRAHRIAGVREQAAAGYPILRQVAVPALRQAQAWGLEREATLVHTLMTLIAVVDDLNLLHRGGARGLALAQASAQAFLARGSVRQPGWRAQVDAIAGTFVAHRLSPGGSADLLACAWFLVQQEAL
ncbi:MAG: triphosphoribosyl-dephospho-CoA synthase MdcB [Pseudoxanthomonas sp.]